MPIDGVAVVASGQERIAEAAAAWLREQAELLDRVAIDLLRVDEARLRLAKQEIAPREFHHAQRRLDHSINLALRPHLLDALDALDPLRESAPGSISEEDVEAALAAVFAATVRVEEQVGDSLVRLRRRDRILRRCRHEAARCRGEGV